MPFLMVTNSKNYTVVTWQYKNITKEEAFGHKAHLYRSLSSDPNRLLMEQK